MCLYIISIYLLKDLYSDICSVDSYLQQMLNSNIDKVNNIKSNRTILHPFIQGQQRRLHQQQQQKRRQPPSKRRRV